MKKPRLLRSIYAKFAILFLVIWWVLTSLTFSAIRVISNSFFVKLSVDHNQLIAEFKRVRTITGLVFLVSAAVGTIIILIAVRGIVKPIKRLSKASKEVAKGNFDIEVKVTSADEMGQLTSDFNLMTRELRNIDVLRKDFVSSVSHEFKTPITSIRGFAKLIRDNRLTEEQFSEYTEIIVNESERLSLLSTNLLKLSELDSKVIREQATVFSLDEQIRKAVLILEAAWSRKEIEFDIDLEEITITGDEHLLQEVWLNLIQNAIKFSHPKGTIRIGLHQSEGLVRVKITDYGIGIREEDRERIFERFFKADKSRSLEGNGLGLVIVKKIVELSNGQVYFESESGKGTTFIVELPH
ncbi:signal transduction histidine kinase [Paenibacillus forsythiae]|uniref:Heme sensor protein HssS n=1 Tax=Paenibacillus forsythiae TaxID=365616 RepID=A0ABU3H2A0_9BACL|nr:HAMP domain-containing sensor histidine kinase [Paenibacillus forsythiae]MDT3424865.1 signal transduction histidine kinase [Paenibacillus forsythiae]